MAKIEVPVAFKGVVLVEVPDGLEQDDQNNLAEKIALSRVLATTNNPDSPEADAFDDYKTEGGKATGSDWDHCRATVVTGWWTRDETD